MRFWGVSPVFNAPRISISGVSMVARACLVLAFVSTLGVCTLAKGPPPLCAEGRWTEASLESIENGTVLPEVQCWREPACIRHTYLTKSRCAERPLDSDWPQDIDQRASSTSGRSTRELFQRAFAGKVVLFTGDSITRGVWDMIVCELSREGLRPRQMTRTRMLFDEDPELVKMQMRFWETWQNGSWGGGQAGNAPHSAHIVQETRTIISNKFASGYSQEDMQAQLDLADILVLNFGHHYPFSQQEERKQYSRDMVSMFRTIKHRAETAGNVAVFRETSAQHFDGTGAYMNWEQAHPTVAKCECVPMPPDVLKDNFVTGYNRAAAAALDEANASSAIRWLPFYDATAEMYNLHEATYCSFVNPMSCCDCTHFCYTPRFGKFLISSLFDALEAPRPEH